MRTNNHIGSANHPSHAPQTNISNHNMNNSNNINANSHYSNSSNNGVGGGGGGGGGHRSNGASNMAGRPFPLRILVHSDVVGAIIGRSGSTIRGITQQTKARIDVHREENAEQQEKVITINGMPDNCSEACFKIIEVVQNEINAKYDSVTDPNRDITLKILASNNLIGRLIGKSGSSIKKMMELTSTRINISANGITESTGEHTIVVIGKLDQVCQAERLISAKLRAAYASDMLASGHHLVGGQAPYLFNNVLLPYMPNPYSQNSILASMVNPQASGSHGGNSMQRTMPPMSAAAAAAAAAAAHHGQHHHHHHQLSSSMYSAPSYLPLYSSSGVPAGAPALMGFNPVAPGFEQERETVYIYVPSTMVGAIIGKSGAAIKEMISTSGASIKVATVPHPSEQTQRNNNNNNNNNNSEQVNNESADTSRVSDPETIDLTTGDEPVPVNRSTSDESTQPQLHQQQEQATAKTTTTTTTATTTTATTTRVSRFPNASNDPLTTRRVTIVGYPASQYSAQYMIYRKIAMEGGKGDTSLMVEFTIPSQCVGKIIGKGGATVKSLQKQTRTTIRLPEDKTSQQSTQAPANGGSGNAAVAAEPETCCVQISGGFEGSQAAQRHIKNMIRESLFLLQVKQGQAAQPSARGHESNGGRLNAQQQQNNNHLPSDTGGKAASSTDETLARTRTSNEKGHSSDNNNKSPVQRESPSLSCNHDCHPTKQGDQKSHPNSKDLSPPSTAAATAASRSNDVEASRDMVDNDQQMISNNNTMINNLNSAKAPTKMAVAGFEPVDGEAAAAGSRKSAGGCHLENGESHKATRC